MLSLRMPTIIKHYRNAFIDIETDSIRILMDPWVNTANEGSWAGCSGEKYILSSQQNKNIDYIYISHLHTDHFDSVFLKKLKHNQNKSFKFLIKKFKDRKLKTQLIKVGFKEKNIIELASFRKFNIDKNSNFLILPQLSASNTPNKLVNYDLDTSCVFINKDVKLFNQVDNPYSVSDFKNILVKLKNIGINNDFDLSFVSYCGASEYPQSFINLDRNKQKKHSINKNLEKFICKFNSIKSKYIVPAGGSYSLDSIFSPLNKYTVVPNFKYVNNFFNRSKITKKNVLINPGKHYFLFHERDSLLRKNLFIKNFQHSHVKNNNNITYEKFKFKIINLKDTIQKLEKQLPKFKKELYDKTNTSIELNIWNKQPVKIDNIELKKATYKHRILFGSAKKKVSLKIHMYYKLFVGIILGKISWNEVQNHCLYERDPNRHDPDAIFWMNLYKF